MLLSIITINYNNAEGLRKTLASVASQTYAEIEHIIIDGGSTDGSVDIIREYADNQCKVESVKCKGTEKGGSDSENNPTPIYTTLHNSTPPKHHVLWVSEPDKGIYNAMNKGIRMATGDYIQILNSGDILAAPDVTERMMAALQDKIKQQHQQHNINNSSVVEQHTTTASENNTSSLYQNRPAILYGNMIKEYPDDHRVKDTCGGGDYTPESFLYFYRGTLNHDCAYIRGDLFEKYGLYNEQMKICSDWEWYVRTIVLGGEKACYTDIDVTIFDMMGVSESGGKNRALIQQERREYLETILPASVLRDYDKYAFPIEQYQRLKKYHLWGLVYLVERMIFKFEKWLKK